MFLYKYVKPWNIMLIKDILETISITSSQIKIALIMYFKSRALDFSTQISKNQTK